VQQTPPRQPSSEPVLAPQDVQLHGEEQPGPAEPAEPAEPAHAKSAAKRREGVSAQATSQTTGTKKPRALHVKTDAERKIIRGATAGNMLFAGIEEKQMDTIIDAMFEMECKQGEVVILQGDVGDNFYVVKSGQYQVYLKIKGDEPVHTYVEKDGRAPAFGELALMYNCPRAATIKCSVPGTLWGLDQETFRDIMMTANKEKHESNAQFLKSVSILQQLTDEQRDALCSTLQEVHFKDGETVVKQGDPADALYFIRKARAPAATTAAAAGACPLPSVRQLSRAARRRRATLR
jgi:cAMP-dependent protein kinase regulator